MEGDKRIDELMLPVLNAINRHVKDREAKTDIYNRAYEALLISMDVKDIEISNLRSENAALRERVRWIPVNEKRPTRGDCATDPLGRPISYVLGCVNGHLYGLIHLDYFDINTTYTHWMPLPQPPEESENE